jgi:hypothetical protein
MIFDDLEDEGSEDREEGEETEIREEMSGDQFEIVVPQLTEDQKREYVRYDNNEM